MSLTSKQLKDILKRTSLVIVHYNSELLPVYVKLYNSFNDALLIYHKWNTSLLNDDNYVRIYNYIIDECNDFTLKTFSRYYKIYASRQEQLIFNT